LCSTPGGVFHYRMSRDPSLSAVSASVSVVDQCLLGMAGKIRDARVRAGKSKADLAECLDVAQSTITRLEGGSRQPSVRTLVEIAFATRLPVGYFFSEVPTR